MKSNKEALKITSLISTYLEDWAPRIISANQGTLDNHRYALSLYFEYLEEKGNSTHNLSHKHFEGAVIEEWKGWLQQGKHKCSPATINNRISVLRSFVGYLGNQDVAWKYLKEEVRDVTVMKTPNTHVRGISEHGMEILFAQIDMNSRIGRRDAVLFITQYDTACRISELLTLTIEYTYLEGEHPYIWVKGKGNKNWACHLQPRTAEYLRLYIAEFHGSHPSPQDLVFYFPCAEIGSRRLTTDAVDKRLTSYAVKAHKICPEVPADLTSHQLRHARATHLIVNHQINILAISKMLGHEQVETTMRYLDFTAEDKAKALAVLKTQTEEDNTKNEKKWLNADGSLKELCRLKARRN
ncbi:MAG: tyrosine-type recombinase/integrase [Succinivibrio dextrinosolvens]|nr:tyrosine-type recombinase/integrase [Succinivibrio dextrinosolvens]